MQTTRVIALALGGPIPADIQNYAVYADGVSAAARDPAAATALLSMLRSDVARTAMKARGMEASAQE